METVSKSTERRVRLTKALRRKILEIAQREDIDASDVIANALTAYEKNQA